MIRISIFTALLASIALGLLSCKPKVVGNPLVTPPKHNPGDIILPVRLNADRTVTIDDTTYTLDELTNHLKAESANIDSIQLEVSPDQPMNDVVSVLNCIAQAGIDSVTYADLPPVATDPPK